MNGLDPIIATTLATRIDSVLNAVSGSVGSIAPSTRGTQEAAPATVPNPGAGTAAPAANQPSSTQTTLSNTALALDAILRLDTSLLGSTGAQPQTTLLSTPPSQASSFTANLAADENLNANAQASAGAAEDISNLATLLGNSSTGTADPAADLAAATTADPAAATANPQALATNAEDLNNLETLLNSTGAAGSTANPATAGLTGNTAANAAAAASTTAAASLATLTGATSSDPVVNALSTALQQAVGNSGLFYESHLAQWLSGTRSSDSLQDEPQAQLNNSAQSAGAQAQIPSGLNNRLTTTLANFLNPSSAQAGNNAGGAQTTSATAAMLTAAKTGSEPAGLPIHPDSVALVRQQLDLLSTSQFQWNGQAWPGAPMNWEITRHDDDSGDSSNSQASADGQIWHTRISLELPGLGRVEAQLALNAKQLTARISASPSSASTLSNNSADLRRRTAAAGLDLLSLQIRQAGSTQDYSDPDDSEMPAVPVASNGSEA